MQIDLSSLLAIDVCVCVGGYIHIAKWAQKRKFKRIEKVTQEHKNQSENEKGHQKHRGKKSLSTILLNLDNVEQF